MSGNQSSNQPTPSLYAAFIIMRMNGVGCVNGIRKYLNRETNCAGVLLRPKALYSALTPHFQNP